MDYVKTRTIDDLRRIVLPKELMEKMGLICGTKLDFYYVDEKTITLKVSDGTYPVEDE